MSYELDNIFLNDYDDADESRYFSTNLFSSTELRKSGIVCLWEEQYIVVHVQVYSSHCIVYQHGQDHHEKTSPEVFLYLRPENGQNK